MKGGILNLLRSFLIDPAQFQNSVFILYSIIAFLLPNKIDLKLKIESSHLIHFISITSIQYSWVFEKDNIEVF
jgi:hypothetical protein